VEKQIISATSQENLANACFHEGCRNFIIAQQLQLLLLLMQNINKTSTIHQPHTEDEERKLRKQGGEEKRKKTGT
jgi:hypothetical protein